MTEVNLDQLQQEIRDSYSQLCDQVNKLVEELIHKGYVKVHSLDYAHFGFPNNVIVFIHSSHREAAYKNPDSLFDVLPRGAVYVIPNLY